MNREQEIKDELLAMNSPLAHMDKAMPYYVPESYFEGLTINARLLAAEQSLPATKGNPYIVPEGYFDNHPEHLMEKLRQEYTQKPRRKNTIWLNVRRMAVAAVVLIAVGLGSYRMLQQPAPLSVEQQLGAIPDAELMAYVQENAYEFDTENIINNLPGTGQEQQAAGIQSEDIESYLQTAGWQ